jgi:hypothetical protein
MFEKGIVDKICTRLLTVDPDWISTLIPIRDGVLVAFRR